jgi:hypothetical protein
VACFVHLMRWLGTLLGALYVAAAVAIIGGGVILTVCGLPWLTALLVLGGVVAWVALLALLGSRVHDDFMYR